MLGSYFNRGMHIFVPKLFPLPFLNIFSINFLKDILLDFSPIYLQNMRRWVKKLSIYDDIWILFHKVF